MTKDTVVILPIAGREERFWPLSDKHFLSFLGKPLIHRSLSQLKKHGFNRVVLVVNRKNKTLADNIVASFPKMMIKTVLQGKKHGLGMAILAATASIFKNVVILSPHDVVEDVIFDQFISQLAQKPEALIVAKKVDKYFPGGYLRLKGDLAHQIIEKPEPNKCPSNSVALVFYYFADGRKLVKKIKTISTLVDDQFEQAVSLLLKAGLRMKVLGYSGDWAYLKYPWHVLNVMDFFLNRLKKSVSQKAKIDKTATVSGNVALGDKVVINANAVVIGPTYIGSGTVVGNNALVRHCHLGKNCVVGFASEVARSYIGDNCWFHKNFIGDSVLGKNVALGAGAVLANLRLDEGEIFTSVRGKKIATDRTKLGAIIGDHVRIGVNASLMPGVKIGSNSTIGPGLVVDRDVPDGQTYLSRDGRPQFTDNRINIASLER